MTLLDTTRARIGSLSLPFHVWTLVIGRRRRPGLLRPTVEPTRGRTRLGSCDPSRTRSRHRRILTSTPLAHAPSRPATAAKLSTSARLDYCDRCLNSCDLSEHSSTGYTVIPWTVASKLIEDSNIFTSSLPSQESKWTALHTICSLHKRSHCRSSKDAICGRGA